MLARTALSTIRTRAYATAAQSPSNEFVAKRIAVREHAQHTTDLWRKISFFVCFPGIAVATLWAYKVEKAHMDHLEHERHDNGGELPERTMYSYLNMRQKPFPWGNQTLFFNPEVNVPAADPEA